DRGGAELAGALHEGGHVTGWCRILHDQVDRGEAECPEAFLVRVRGEHRPAVQTAAKTGPQCLVGRDQEGRSHVRMVAGRSPGVGNSMVNVQPGRPGWLRTRRVARGASAMLLQMAKPSPEPRAFEVTNGLNILSNSSGGIPGPVSEISTSREFPPASRRSATLTVSSPPWLMASMAFKHKLWKSCSNSD